MNLIEESVYCGKPPYFLKWSRTPPPYFKDIHAYLLVVSFPDNLTSNPPLLLLLLLLLLSPSPLPPCRLEIKEFDHLCLACLERVLLGVFVGGVWMCHSGGWMCDLIPCEDFIYYNYKIYVYIIYVLI